MKKNRKDFIFDLETLGANVHICPVVDMAYAVFEWDRFLDEPYTFEELTQMVHTVKVDVEDQVNNYGCSFKKTDVEWWSKLPKIARDKLKRTKNDLTVVDFCDTIIEFLKDNPKIDYWWSRGNTFDPIIIWRLMNDTNNESTFDRNLKFYKVRDIRTHIDAKLNYETQNGFIPLADATYWENSFVAHNSTHDVAADILRIQAIHRAENDLEQTTR